MVGSQETRSPVRGCIWANNYTGFVAGPTDAHYFDVDIDLWVLTSLIWGATADGQK